MTVGKIYCVKLMVMKYRNKGGQVNINEPPEKEVGDFVISILLHTPSVGIIRSKDCWLITYPRYRTFSPRMPCYKS